MTRAPSRPRTGATATPVDAPAPPGPPARRTQAERREEAERRLLDAALRLVARRGSVRMTLAEVGEAAGYSRGLPAHRFGSKAGLVHALAGHIGRRFSEQRERQSTTASGLQAILGNIHFYFSRNVRSPGDLRTADEGVATRALLVMMTESFMDPSPALRGELAAYNRQALAWFEEQIATGIARGEIVADADPATLAVLLLGAMRGVMLQWLVDDEIPLAAVRDRLLEIVERVLRRTG